MNGIVIVDKPRGFTSFDVCALVRKIYHEKKTGHAGTLDPEATGVLPVFLGSAAKAADILPADDKVYLAEMTLGIETDTEDIFGNVLAERPYEGTEEELREAVLSFTGTYAQVPPMYSAKKVDGKKLYELARAGKTVERKAVPVTVYGIDVVSVELPKAVIRVHCSKGTYIRTLIADIGKKAGSLACMSALRREKHGVFGLSEAVTVDELKKAAEAGKEADFVLGTDAVFAAYPAVRVRKDAMRFLLNGNKLIPEDLEERAAFAEDPAGACESAGVLLEDGASVRVYGADGAFRALYIYKRAENAFLPRKMFLS